MGTDVDIVISALVIGAPILAASFAIMGLGTALNPLPLPPTTPSVEV